MIRSEKEREITEKALTGLLVGVAVLARDMVQPGVHPAIITLQRLALLSEIDVLGAQIREWDNRTETESR